MRFSRVCPNFEQGDFCPFFIMTSSSRGPCAEGRTGGAAQGVQRGAAPLLGSALGAARSAREETHVHILNLCIRILVRNPMVVFRYRNRTSSVPPQKQNEDRFCSGTLQLRLLIC